MAATRAMIRAGVEDLTLFAIPTSGLQADLLIGAGAVAEIEFSAVSLGEFGLAPRFTDAVMNNRIVYRDATCPAMHAGILAGEKGVPFVPLRGVIGSDILARRPDWLVIQNPFDRNEDPILLVPAIRPDIAIFHAPKADRQGNVWIGTRRELAAMAHAATRTLVTVEEVVDDSLLDDPALAPGVVQKLYIDAVAEAPRGAWPLGLAGHYPPDTDHLRRYAKAARDEDGFRAYLETAFAAAAPDTAP